MSHFSRIQLNHAHPRAHEALLDSGVSNAYVEHQWLWRFFPSEAGTARDFLFRRMEAEGRRTHPVYYVVSRRAPIAPQPAWQVETRAYRPALREGMRLAFDLRANPVRSVRREGGRSQRHDVIMHAKKALLAERGAARWAELPPDARPPLYGIVQDAVCNWFVGSVEAPGVAQRHGFRADASMLRVDAYRTHEYPRKGGKPVAMSTVDIRGVLEVADPTRAEAALLTGIGHGKAFGCGLLLVRPEE